PIATVLGVGLAIGLARWRGRGSGAANTLMLFPLVTPELVMGTALFLIFDHLFARVVGFGTGAQVLGHVTFSLSYVVIVTRGRLFAIGREYEEAAMDLGASPAQALRRILLPLLAPAILASLFIVFAISIDDFVISQFLCIEGCTTIPVKIYSSARNAGKPSLNALASIMMVSSLLAITFAVLVQRAFNRRRGGGSAVEDFARLEI
ncbi:MAG: ABC transporter permease, partial [Gaiellaceae bacterium]